MSSSFDADVFASCFNALCTLTSAMVQFNKSICILMLPADSFLEQAAFFFFSLILIQVSSWSLCRHRFSPCCSLSVGGILFFRLSLSPDLQCRGEVLLKVCKGGVIWLCRLLGTLYNTDELTVINYLATNELGECFLHFCYCQ